MCTATCWLMCSQHARIEYRLDVTHTIHLAAMHHRHIPRSSTVVCTLVSALAPLMNIELHMQGVLKHPATDTAPALVGPGSSSGITANIKRRVTSGPVLPILWHLTKSVRLSKSLMRDLMRY